MAELLKTTDVLLVLGLPKSTLYKMIEDKKFPQPIREANHFRHNPDEVRDYINNHISPEKREACLARLETIERVRIEKARSVPIGEYKEGQKYAILPHPKGGFYAVELPIAKYSWKSVNYCCEELAQTAIRKRESTASKIAKVKHIKGSIKKWVL